MSTMNNLHMDTEAARVTSDLFDALAKNGELREQNKRLRELLVIAETSLVAIYAALGCDPESSHAIRQIRASNDEA